MAKSSEELKTMTEEFFKITNIKYDDTSEKVKEKNPQIDWQLVVGKQVHIAVMKNRVDRVNFISAMLFSEDDQKGINELLKNDPEYFNSINELFVLKDCSNVWRKDKEGKILGINISTYIDSEEYNRPNFFKIMTRLGLLQTQMSRKLGIKIKSQQTNLTDSNTAEKSMYG